MGSSVGNLLKPIGTVAALATGNPELIPLVAGGSDLVNGKGIGRALGDAALSFGGTELGGALGNAFPETLGSTFGTGGNSLTDLLGTTSGAGSFLGDGTIGGDISNLFDKASATGAGGLLPTSGNSTTYLNNGLQAGTGYSGASGPILNAGGGGPSSFSGNDLTSEFAKGLADGTGYSPAISGSSYASAAPASSGGIGGFLSKNAVPLIGAASSLGSNVAAQGALTDATNKANAQLTPYLQTGGAASGKIGDYLGLSGSGTSASDILAASPGYQFQLDQGNRALAAQQAAAGSLNSGAAQKAAEQFGQGLASTTGQQYLSNLQQTAGTGLGAAGQYGNNTTALGTAKGGADIATGNTLAQLLSGVGGKRVVGYGTNGQPIYGA